ncbi:serine/threonine-protein kinase pim-3-like [Bolinopsis microptera]|uniref:serine/threonine-protein kinase pim-3-like n=1 Tax=Bolinopsis microptera TaxID=2820187 RepID=UPI00307A7966
MGNSILKPTNLLCAFSSSEKREFKSKYQLGKCIGSGSYGQIIEATQTSTFRTVAVKYLKKKNVESMLKMQKQNLPAEAVFLSSLDHRNIISLIDLYEFPNKFALIMERPLASLDIHDFIEKYGPQNDSVASYIEHQLLSVCQYLDNNLIFHRDIKSENILVNAYDYNIKLIDFGSATYANQDIYYGNFGTPAFSPPEWISDSGYKPEPTTVWSCGVVLFEILTATLPFYDEEHVMRATLFFPDLVSHSGRDLIRKMLKRDENDRICFEEALNHPFITVSGDCGENERILDDSTYSKCSAYTLYENINCDSELPLSLI